MKPYQRLLCLSAASAACFNSAGPLRSAAADPRCSPVPTRVDNDANTRKGFDHFYNLEYDKAIHEFELAQQAHPDDPFA